MVQRSACTLDFAVATDIGCIRKNNEDSFGYDALQQVYVVCDGMGGSAAGEVASSIAVTSLLETFLGLSTPSDKNDQPMPPEERLLRSIHEANWAVREVAHANAAFHNMGTTLVCACLSGQKIFVGNVGDSRAYLIRDGDCRQMTLDHSLLDEQVRHGLITPEMAAVSNLQSVITRAIGTADTVEPDLFVAELKNRDMVLLTSDGLTRYAGPQEIVALAPPDRDLTAICNSLIQHAKRRGGADNITCMMLRVLESPAPGSPLETPSRPPETP